MELNPQEVHHELINHKLDLKSQKFDEVLFFLPKRVSLNYSIKFKRRISLGIT